MQLSIEHLTHLPAILALMLLYMVSSTMFFLFVGTLIGASYSSEINATVCRMYVERVVPYSRELICTTLGVDEKED